jgi:formate hydrogenlyase transcriptional activator
MGMAFNLAAVQAPSERHLYRYEELLRASSAIASCRDSRTVVERFANELKRFVQFDYVLITVIDESTKGVRWRVFKTFGHDESLKLPELLPNESPSGIVYETQKPIIISDWPSETRYTKLRDYMAQYNIRSSCVLPLSTVHRRIGAFAVGVSVPNAYSAEEIRFFSLVADHIALAVDSALNMETSQRARAELEDKNGRLQLMLDLTNRLVASLDLRDLRRTPWAGPWEPHDNARVALDVDVPAFMTRLIERLAALVERTAP